MRKWVRDMNYKKIYEDLIYKRSVSQCLSEDSIGCENHHVVPISEGGSDDSTNIIRLTIREYIVVQFDFDMNIVNEFISAREAERVTGTSHNSISRCCNGKLNSANGFIWRFKET